MLAGLFLLLIAAGALAAGVGYVRTARRMHSFQTTRARITGRETIRVVGTHRQEARFGSGGGYTPKFTYTYDVGGQTYTGDKWTYATRGFKQAIADQKARDMPEEVDVHFNPSDPSEAYLETNSTTLGWWLIALGIALMLIALVLVLGS